MSDAEKKKFRDRATRAAHELKKEKSIHGHINDGAGRRYRIGVYFLLAGDLEKSTEAFDWFYDEFPDDIGEPVFCLYGALAAYRSGERHKARIRLLETMLSNIFLLPFLIGQRLGTPDVWHPSNRQQESYLLEIEEFLFEPTDEERSWIKDELSTASFTALRNDYITTFSSLIGEQDIARRMAILGKWQSLQAEYFDNEG